MPAYRRNSSGTLVAALLSISSEDIIVTLAGVFSKAASKRLKVKVTGSMSTDFCALAKLIAKKQKNKTAKRTLGAKG
jgi:hypothetical protein